MAFYQDGTRVGGRASGARAGLVGPLYKTSANRAGRTFYRPNGSAYYRAPGGTMPVCPAQWWRCPHAVNGTNDNQKCSIQCNT
ncbi:MAG: hypothetical protein CPDRYMAC_3379 [uncultured Paraburkholderia sp.]|nr:MAG: hypothetical protein CPDRYDRY_3168 [uncultured Paraburkholderia sp.]CAH2930464.1 MAG: hypothetical protein CPDRYMAC_3379 [uncultured Paraburkholderia sp.]